jgi:Uma2 family endonuclease
MESMLPYPASLISNPIRRLTRAEYDRMVLEGFFQDEKVELLFGMVVAMSPIDPSHNESVDRLYRFLSMQLGERARVRAQSSFAATEDSEPEPDLYVFPPGDYWHEHPNHAHLVIEVSRTSLANDRGAKRFLYSVGGVDEYWIVNLPDGIVEVHRDREDGGWRTVTKHARGETLALRAFPDVQIAVADILPPAS